MGFNDLDFAANIKSFRHRSGLSQEAVAKACGVSIQAVSKWENARSLPDLRMLPTLSELFGITLDELFFTKPDLEISSGTRGTKGVEKKGIIEVVYDHSDCYYVNIIVKVDQFVKRYGENT